MRNLLKDRMTHVENYYYIIDHTHTQIIPFDFIQLFYYFTFYYLSDHHSRYLPRSQERYTEITSN